MLFKGCGVVIHLCKQCGRVLPFRPVPVVKVRFYVEVMSQRLRKTLPCVRPPPVYNVRSTRPLNLNEAHTLNPEFVWSKVMMV